MSDWSIFELDDIVLDVFGDDYAQIVPHSSVGKANFDAQCDTHKKARHDIQNFKDRSVETKESKEDVFHGNHETTTFQSLSTDEKSQSVNCPSHPSESVFPFSDAPKCMDEINTFSPDDTRTINDSLNGQTVVAHGDDVFSDDQTPISSSVVDEGNLCLFSVEVSPSETGLDGQDNESKVNEKSDILDYDWPDVGCFDDVDKMLSYSTFGQGRSGNGNELSWLLSSSYTVDCSEETFKSGLQSSFSDLNALSGSSQTDMITWSDNSLQTVNGDNISSFAYESLTHWLEEDVQDKTDFPSKSEVAMKKEGKNQLQKENISASENTSGCSYPLPATVAQNNNHILTTSSPASSLTSFPHFSDSQSRCMDSYSSGCLNTPCTKSHTPQPSPTVVSSSSIKSPKEDKHSCLIHIPVEASNNGQLSMKIFSPSSSSPTVIAAKKMEGMHLGQQLHTEVPIGHPHLKHVSSSGSTNQDSTKTNLYEQRSRVGRNSKLEKGSQEHCGDENAPFSHGNSYTTCSGDILSGRRTFQELQGIMNQLDIRLKLRIRDGLYRLAKSAEQRHSVESPKLNCRDKMDPSKFIAIDKSKRCDGYMDIEMETGTNPIDRSIVHLLFQRTSEHTSCPAEDAMPCKTC